MSSLLLVGDRVYLRLITLADATPEYVGWLNDPETTRYLESGGGGETVESVRSYIDRFINRGDVVFAAIVLKENDRHVGNIKIEPINFRHRNAVLGIMIGDPSARGKGVGGEAIGLMLRHLFDQLGLHRVALGVTADNLAAIRCYERIGFKEEGRFRDAVLRDHGYVDSIWMAILDGEFRARYG